jgi:broad-specificity NMP kinase
MAGLIFINGSPGTGKSTTALLLQKALNSPFIELSDLRDWHLNPDWSNQSDAEAQMAFENLVFILKNYLKYGFENVISTDFREVHIRQVPAQFAGDSYFIFTLVVSDDDVIKSRLETRNSGFKNYQAAIAWNRREIERPLLPASHEIKIDTTSLTPEEVVQKILSYL